uniref:Protein kinase domain-containing protein n=1 Tax=Calcidiscus leptoporus TaxID=127549 RepID=A0A7S0NUL0_9EUKA|mmetsp:Transcript_24346/g.56605  ORF Transcript_24346/g.56605 Transcript_24346/m.56605 type:complete len:297 (+) Transcript_24346:413-1303(+)
MAEVACMRLVGGHPTIIKFLHYQEAPHARGEAWVFLELATGGDLFDRLTDAGSLTEGSTRPYAVGLLSALNHCHCKGLVHRDVKLDNVLLSAEDPFGVKLIDFGLAVQVPLKDDGSFLPDHRIYDGVGTKSYKAPEIFAPRSGYEAPPVDSWALGITLFSLLAGFFPFDQANGADWRYTQFTQGVRGDASACDVLFATYKRACTFSAPCKQLLDGLLCADPKARLSVRAAAEHEWCKAPPVAFHSQQSADADGVEIVYRSCHDERDRLDEALTEALELPDEAVRVTRQVARLNDDS